MKFKYSGFHILIRTLMMFAVLVAAAYGIVHEIYWLALLMIPVVIILIYSYYSYHRKASEEIKQFVESVHYRDFTRYFDVKKAPTELQPFRMGFNEINTTFKSISKEKETQFLHLKSILEIVDTGIFSYETESGEVLWMNESLKSLLQIPYLKTVHSLEKRNNQLYKIILLLQAGQKAVTSIQRENLVSKIQLSATMFQHESKTYKLIAFQNINEALDEEESKAWQKLLSVMTHEIMNSVAPISSLAETLKNRIAETEGQPEAQAEALTDIETGIATIQKRSEGLLKFTETYRNLSKINKINPSPILVIELFDHVQQLMQPNIDKRKIDFEIILRDPLLSINVDSGLIEQVLINLILNAMDAVKENESPRIVLSAEHVKNKTVIKISDNGNGIEPEILDKIFIPFFSTKKTGSGIGLSLCKQVMMLHRGQINVQSVLKEGTIFSLIFE